MFLAEFFRLAIIILAVFLGYKYRHLILKWLNTRPQSSVTNKRGVVRDLDVLMKYGVDDAIPRIVGEERKWAENVNNMQKQLRDMNDEVRQKFEDKIDKPDKPSGAAV